VVGHKEGVIEGKSVILNDGFDVGKMEGFDGFWVILNVREVPLPTGLPNG
jgi:hypothetical protein